ncbi:hypothetical protein [Streptomyces sp. MA5143a]|uniref:hypothetical protein n=1 Tax=Streptomyces sp. MA5143a TaxID=2083010 RepID=UPI0011B20952|nr:hypothetical protein [Streptomyces sp. MA5143a]
MAADVIRSLIEAEKEVEGELAKLNIDELLSLLATVDPGGAGGARRCPLREVVQAVRPGVFRGTDARPEVPVLRPADLSERELGASGFPSAATELTRGAVLLPGDVLFAPADATGRSYRAAVWRGERGQATYSPGVLCIRPDTTRLVADYLVAWLMLPEVQQRIHTVARSSVGLQFLSPSRLLDAEMEVPSLAAQEAFTGRHAAITRERRVRQAQLAKLRRVKGILVDNLRRSMA